MSENWYDETELDSSDDESLTPVDELEALESADDLGDAQSGAGGSRGMVFS